MALSKNQMAVSLAKLEWQLDGIILNVDTWTKQDTKRQLNILMQQVVNLQTEHESPRARKTKPKDEEIQDDETSQNEPEGQPEELSEQSQPDA